MFDKDAARGWIGVIPVPPDVPGQQLRQAVWEQLVDAADENGRIRTSASQIAEALGQDRRRPPSAKGVKAATAWLRKRGLLVTVEGPAPDDQANTYQLTAPPPQPARRPRPAAAGPPAGQDPAITTATAWLSQDTADEGLGEDIAHWVAGICAVRDGGPGWVETARQVRPDLDQLPEHARRHYARTLITTLRGKGWLAHTTEQDSLTAGPRLKHRHPIATASRHTTGVTDRGY